MFIVFLTLGENRDKVPDYLEDHKAWLKRGLDDGVFLLAGTLEPGRGGAILAHNLDQAALEARVSEDPFVANGVVAYEIHEVSPAFTDERLAFLKS
ncbi:YciI family protein [Kordiimonas marina]|uniref:YciI family protein n=1 Tax=Kordiimonas marina TaxID=2872312 RepID=UPI001FF23434|nr:YciI family protein [Kordiimonas marina]MCJ9430223.1 YciI family protein [Kordiimonas marina]